MNHRLTFASLAAMGVASLSSSALAEEATAADGWDRGVRFRGGIASELALMALVEPLEGYVASGFQGHAGVQLGDIVGVYGVPYVGFLSGIGGGPVFGTALLVDFTVADAVALGIGPEFAYFHKVGGEGHHFGPEAAIRVHGAVYPLSTLDEDGRRGFAVGTDLRVMGGGVGFSDCGGCEQGGPLMLSAGLFVGYEVY